MRDLRALLISSVVVVALGGCSANPSASGTVDAPAAAAARTAVPQVAVVDVGTGVRVDLAAQLATDRPTLLWMWAPS